MSEFESKMSSSSGAADVVQECETLRGQLNLLLAGVVCLSLIVTAYLGIQFWRTYKDVNISRPQAMQIIEMNKKSAPVLKNFVSKLSDYSKTHLDFAQFLAQNQIKLNANSSGSAPVTEPSLETAPGAAK